MQLKIMSDKSNENEFIAGLPRARAPYSWYMVNFFSFGCQVIDRAYVLVFRLYGWGRGEYQKERRGVSQDIHNCWFSHDVTKIQIKKLSILPRFYFHDALEQLKTNFRTNFCFKRSSWFCDRASTLEFLSFCVTRHLHWDGQESCHVGQKMTYIRKFCYLNSSSIRKSITLMFMSSSRSKFTLLQQNSVTDVSVGFRPPCWSSSR